MKNLFAISTHLIRNSADIVCSRKTADSLLNKCFFFSRNQNNTGYFQFESRFRFFGMSLLIHPKNKRVFADRLFFGRKYANYKGFR